ncbi:MAG: PAS domain-containing protein [Desulfovibrionaceae bacterium]
MPDTTPPLLTAALAAQDGLALVDRDAVHVAINPAYAALFASEAHTISGRGLAALWGDEQFASTLRPCLDRCLEGHTSRCDACPPGQDTMVVELAFSPVRGAKGQVDAVAITCRDTTDRYDAHLRAVRTLDQKRVAHMKAAAAVDELTRERATLLDSLPVGVLIADRRLRLAEANAILLSQCGLYTDQEGSPSVSDALNVLAASDCPWHDLVRDAFISRAPVASKPVACPRGGKRCVMAATPFLDDLGRCTGVVLTVQPA